MALSGFKAMSNQSWLPEGSFCLLPACPAAIYDSCDRAAKLLLVEIDIPSPANFALLFTEDCRLLWAPSIKNPRAQSFEFLQEPLH